MKNLKIIVADDHPLLRKGIKAALEGHHGWSISDVADGAGAIEMARMIKPDILITDITMPGVDGIEVTRRVLQENPSIKVIVLTMHQNAHYAADAMRAGACGYLLKGSDAEELLKAIETVKAGKRYISPNIADELLNSYVLREEREADPFDKLTEKEKEVLKLIAEGATSREIGERLSRSVSMIKKYRSVIMEKLGVEDMAGLIRIALDKKIVKN